MRASVNFIEISGSGDFAHDKQKADFWVICFFDEKRVFSIKSEDINRVFFRRPDNHTPKSEVVLMVNFLIKQMY